MKLKLKSRLQEEITITSDMQMTPPLGQKVKKPLDESEKECKSWLKIQHSKPKIMASTYHPKFLLFTIYISCSRPVSLDSMEALTF